MQCLRMWRPAFTVALLVAAASIAAPALAQQGAAPASANPDLQRSYQIDRYTELAPGGAARGENIYFYKCFVCHNLYAKGGPPLAKLFEHPQLITGEQATDQAVARIINKGTAGMPGFEHTLSAADMEDMLSYLKRDDCCYEAKTPPANPYYSAATRNWSVPGALRGGVRGVVRSGTGVLEGIKVQLIAPNNVRTTVSTDENGKYEFPAMQAGEYVLRVATPLSYKAYQRDAVRIDGHSSLSDIVLDPVAQPTPGKLPGALPATEEIAAQLSGSELLWNLPGSNEEKIAFIRTCGIGCHGLNQVLRNRFDERGWRVLTGWMTSRGSGSIFVVRPPPSALSADAELVVKWLARVRSPESKDEPYRPFPRPAGASTKIVVTEYELPRRFLSVHQITGDAQGNIWYTSHRTPYIGMLNPRTGLVKEYMVPEVPGAFPGSFKIVVDRKNIVWFSQNWAHRLSRLDPATGEFKQVHIQSKAPINAGGFGNFGLAPDGFIWSEDDNNTIVKRDPASGEILERHPLTRNSNPADNLISANGRFWGGGAPSMGSNTGMILDIRSGKMYEANSGDLPTSGARGGFDRNNNVWLGGHMGSLVQIVNEIDKGRGITLRSYTPPTPYFPYSQFFFAAPDKHGEVWSPLLHGRGFVRFNPAKNTWQVYDNAEPSAFSRNIWVDNSTTPVSVWLPDYQMGTLVRIQPRD